MKAICNAGVHAGKALVILAFSSLLFAIVPSDLRESDPLSEALYHKESFEGEQAIVSNVPQFARTMILERLQNDPGNPVFYRALAEVELQLLDETQAETHMKQFVEMSTDKDSAYYKLEDFFHNRTRYEDEFKTMMDHARAAALKPNDPDSNIGPYLHYRRALTQIQNYGLKQDQEIIYHTIVETYPESQKPLLDLLEFERVKHGNTKALEILEQFHQKFPNENKTYLLKKASLLDPQKGFELLNTSYDPLWDIDLARELDQASIRAGKKGDYLAALKDKLEKQSLDLDSVTRLFHSYYFAGNTIEATSILNDYRLLKEKNVQEKKSKWEADELWIMAQLHHRILNLNEAARFYYAVYGAESQKLKPVRYSSVTADDALHGLFQILITAEERPIQLGAGNLDLYKDIATADSNPGVLNGILSLILNNTHPDSEFEQQENKAIGYFNRAQAGAILRLTQKDYPTSKHLPGMYKDVLKIYQKYGMDDLIIKTGENFFKAFPTSDEILEIGIAVTDAYSRKQDHSHEWQTYEYLLPIAAKRDAGQIGQQQSAPDTNTEDEEQSYQDQQPAPTESAYTYSALLKRYISSLTQEKNYNAVLKLYRDQIQKYPTEEALYENFAEYLAQNNLFDEEASIYSHAIQQFKTKSWYEKLARWYLRREQSAELETLSHEVIDTFQGTEVAQYLQNVNTTYPYRSLYIALNRYALSSFPYNMTFVNNLLTVYSEHNYYNWEEWEKLCKQYYFLDESIRSRYLYRLAYQDQLKQNKNTSSNPDKLFAADKEIWRAHFQESLPLYDDLAKQYPADPWINTRVADLKRSLGWQQPSYYKESAQLREYLAKVTPTDSSLWTTAGETLAEVEDYSSAKQYWENILKIDPQNSERYLEVATILWDYYLFDDALNVIQRARTLKDSDSLFAYEAGAIYESKRDYQTAVAEYSKSLVDASEEARNRLNQLYRRPKLATLIRAHLENQLQQNPQNANWWLGVIAFYSDQKEKDVVRELITRATTTLKPENFADAVNSLNETARNFGFDSLQESLIQKRVQYASTDLEKINVNLELVSFYDSRGQKDKAESALLMLYQHQKASAGLIQELISFYWRNGNYDKAFEIYDASLKIANSKYHKQYLREMVDRYRERKNYDRALTAVAELRKEDPLNGDLFRIVSEIYAEQGNYQAMVQHYRDGLQMVRDSKMSEDEKKQQIAVMRRGIIQANLILKDYTAALDQYIELLNRDAENEALLSETAFFASRYGISSRLFDYYNKTAAASPKDHRWPMLLGRLHLYSSNPEAAIDQFRAAIAIRPERVDLHQSLADAYQRSGKYPEALQEFDRFYALTYKDSRWLSSMAELNARLGNQKKALELYEQYLADRKPLERDFEMSQKCLSWGMSKSAIAYGNAGVKKFQTEITLWVPPEGFAAYIEALVQNNSAGTALELMHQTLNRIEVAKKKATFDTEALRSVEYMIQDSMVRVLPALVKKYSTGDELDVLESKLLALNAVSNNEQRSKRLLPFAQAAGLAKAEEQLLRQLVHERYDSDKSHYSTNRETLRRFYLDRQQYATCAKYLEAEWRKYRHHSDYRGELLQVADAYRLARLHDNELVILREYYNFGRDNTLTLDAASVERYLTLLYEKSLRAELFAATATADLTAANFFVKKKDHELAERSIETLSKFHDPVWKTIHLAMLEKEFGVKCVSGLFIAGLDLRNIGDSIATHSDSKQSVIGDDWFYYGTRYGERLWNANCAEAPFYLVSDIEGAPLRSERQDQLGSWYLNTAKLNELALNHFTLAAELDPKNANYQDHIAKTLYALGKKDEAIALWKSLLATQTPSNYLLVCEAASNHDFMTAVDADIEKYLTTQIGKYGAAGLNDLIETYLENVSSEKRRALIPKWITAAPAPKEFGSALLEISALEQQDRNLVYTQAANYLKTWMRSAAGNEIEVARNQWVLWNYLASSEYLENKQNDLTNEVTKEVLDELKRISETNTPRVQKFTLLNAQALLRLGKTDEAVDLLRKYVHGDLTDPAQLENAAIDDEKYLKANQLMRDEGHPAEAANVLEEMYERKLLAGVTDSSIFIGLSQIRLDQNKNDEALQYLNRMIYSSPENLDNFNLAAELLEKNNQFDEALNLRNELKKRRSWDEANLIQIAEDLAASGKSKDASIIAKAVLQSEQSTLEYQARAAKVYGTSTSALAGKLEMQKIEKAVRTKSYDTQTPLYYSSLRQILIERNPSLDLLLAEKFVNPHNSNLEAPLFRAYRNAGLCDQALEALDRDNLSSRNYQDEEEYSGRYGYDQDPFYDYDEYDPTETYPINKLRLTDQESVDLALEAAECAGKIDNSIRQLFFLNVALDHAQSDSKRAEIEEMIEKVEDAANEKAEVEAARWKVQSNLGRQS